MKDDSPSESSATGASSSQNDFGSGGQPISTPSSHSFSMIRRVAWRELFPWLILFRSFQIAFSPSVILLSTVALLLTPIGWFFSELVFVGEPMASAVPGLEESLERNRSPYRRLDSQHDEFGDLANWLPFNSRGFLRGIHRDFSEPYWASLDLVDADHLDQEAILEEEEQPRENAFGLRRFAYYSFGALWTLAVWSLFAGAITRMAVVKLGKNERVGLKDAVLFAVKKYLSFLSAPLMPLSVVLLFMLLMALPGLLMHFTAGAFIVSLIWGILLFGSVIITLLLFILMFCWPLMFPAISAEGGDAFDSVSRSYTYTYQRPLQYLFYATIAVFMMGFGGVLMVMFTESALQVTRWGVSWGAGEQVVIDYTTGFPVEEEEGSLSKATYHVIGFWESTARTIGIGYLYGLFWCIASAVYLVLRRSVDETEIDDVFSDGDDNVDKLPALADPPASPKDKTEPAKEEPDAKNETASEDNATTSSSEADDAGAEQGAEQATDQATQDSGESSSGDTESDSKPAE